MARLDEAAERLQEALAQLERVIASRGDDDDGLRSALDAARRENAELQRLAEEVSAGLDGAVGRLKGMLEEA